MPNGKFHSFKVDNSNEFLSQKDNKNFDVIIIGGSYSELFATMALGRSLKDVVIIDSRKPCNRNTPHSHNFITHDVAVPEIFSCGDNSTPMRSIAYAIATGNISGAMVNHVHQQSCSNYNFR